MIGGGNVLADPQDFWYSARSSTGYNFRESMFRALSSAKRGLSLRDLLRSPRDGYIHIVEKLLLLNSETNGHRWLITSPQPAAGVTATAIGLAHTLGACNRNTLLIDANFADPSLSRTCCDQTTCGLLQVLRGDCLPEDAFVNIPSGAGFAILPAGADKHHPLVFADRERLNARLDTLSGLFDLVLIDGPDVASGTSAQMIAPCVDDCILVVRAQAAGRQQIIDSRRELEESGGRLSGLIFNGEKWWAKWLSNRC